VTENLKKIDKVRDPEVKAKKEPFLSPNPSKEVKAEAKIGSPNLDPSLFLNLNLDLDLIIKKNLDLDLDPIEVGLSLNQSPVLGQDQDQRVEKVDLLIKIIN